MERFTRYKIWKLIVPLLLNSEFLSVSSKMRKVNRVKSTDETKHAKCKEKMKEYKREREFAEEEKSTRKGDFYGWMPIYP